MLFFRATAGWTGIHTALSKRLLAGYLAAAADLLPEITLIMDSPADPEAASTARALPLAAAYNSCLMPVLCNL